MKKTIFVLILCLGLLCACALAEGARLPEVAAFSGGLLTHESTDDQGSYVRMLYRGSDADVRRVADAYISLLTESYGMTEIFTFDDVISDSDLRYYRAYSAPAHPEIGSFSVDTEAGRIENWQLYVEYSQVANNDRNYLWLIYSSGFTYEDTGDRLANAPVAELMPMSSVSAGCSLCSFDGLCDTCGGLGYQEMAAYGGGTVQVVCAAGCMDGKCSACASEDDKVDLSKPYVFKDKTVEKAVREILEKADSSEVTYGDLLNVTDLTVAFEELSDLSDLAFMTKLTSLDLASNQISDISPLAGLTNLTELNISYNNISDISPLAGLTKLTELDIRRNNISDISPLKGLTKLTELNIGSNNISDISPLAGLTNLKSLIIYNNNISDISTLAGLTNLTELIIDNNNISDISALAGLTNLTKLYLDGNNISDISALAGLSNLTELWISYNNISDISPLKDLPELRILYYDDDLIDDIDMLKPTPKPTATPKPYKAPIVGNDGLLVMSPEEYLGIESCDDIYQQDNWYYYEYTDRGYEWYDDGTSNPVDWYKIEDYVDALVASGYYEICDYRDEGEEGDYYSLSYIGPGSVKRTFKVLNSAKKGAIGIRNCLGDICIYYSLDITTNDLEDTQYRLNKYIFDYDPNSNDDSGDDPKPTARPTEKPPERCSICGGSGERNCMTCGGSGYTGYGSDRHKCPSFNCNSGKVKCWTCGGDGKK